MPAQHILPARIKHYREGEYVKLRPSSHSSDYTLVAVYKTVRDAIRAETAVTAFLSSNEKKKTGFFFTEGGADWSPHRSKVRRKGKMVVFTYDATKRIRHLEKLMRRSARPSKLYWEPQKLAIRMLVPKGITPETTPNVTAVVLNPDRAREIACLNRKCGKPRAEATSNIRNHYLVWHYAGTQLYNQYSNTLDFARTIDLRKRNDLSVDAKEWRELYED